MDKTSPQYILKETLENLPRENLLKLIQVYTRDISPNEVLETVDIITNRDDTLNVSRIKEIVKPQIEKLQVVIDRFNKCRPNVFDKVNLSVITSEIIGSEEHREYLRLIDQIEILDGDPRKCSKNIELKYRTRIDELSEAMLSICGFYKDDEARWRSSNPPYQKEIGLMTNDEYGDFLNVYNSFKHILFVSLDEDVDVEMDDEAYDKYLDEHEKMLKEYFI